MEGHILYSRCRNCGKALEHESAEGLCRACKYLRHKAEKSAEWKRKNLAKKGKNLPACAANTPDNRAAWGCKDE